MSLAGALAAVQMSMVNQQKRACPVRRSKVSDRAAYNTDPSGQKTPTARKTPLRPSGMWIRSAGI